jgi:hypothetical protein
MDEDESARPGSPDANGNEARFRALDGLAIVDFSGQEGTDGKRSSILQLAYLNIVKVFSLESRAFQRGSAFSAWLKQPVVGIFKKWHHMCPGGKRTRSTRFLIKS